MQVNKCDETSRYDLCMDKGYMFRLLFQLKAKLQQILEAKSSVLFFMFKVLIK